MWRQMKKDYSEKSNRRNSAGGMTYIKSAAEIPDFKSEDEVAEWYETHSTVLIHDQLETLPAKVGGKLASKVAARRRELASERETSRLLSSPQNRRRLLAALRRARLGKGKPENVASLRREMGLDR